MRYRPGRIALHHRHGRNGASDNAPGCNYGPTPNRYVGQDDSSRANVCVILDPDRDIVFSVLFLPRGHTVQMRKNRASYSKLHIASDRHPLGVSRLNQDVKSDVNVRSDSHSSPTVHQDTQSECTGHPLHQSLENSVF